MKIFEQICEEKIRQAQQNGVFEDLPGKGEPLDIDEMSQIPEELRAAYKILKNSGYLPEEIELKKEMITLDDLIKNSIDQEEITELQRQKNEKLLRFNQLMEKRNSSNNKAMNKYKSKIQARLK